MSHTPIKDLCLTRVAELKLQPAYRRWVHLSASFVCALVAIATAGVAILAYGEGGDAVETAAYGAIFGPLIFLFMFERPLLDFFSAHPGATDERVDAWLLGQLLQLPEGPATTPLSLSLAEIADRVRSGERLKLSDAIKIEAKHLAANPALAGDAKAFVEKMAQRNQEAGGA